MASENERFIKSYTGFIGSVIWRDDGLFKLYHYCLYKASRNLYAWHELLIQPGELPVSHRAAAAELGWSRDKLEKKLTRLQATGLITLTAGRHGTLIRICNWPDYLTAGGTETKPERYGNQADIGTEISPKRLENQTANGTEISPAWHKNQTTDGTEISPVWLENQTANGTEISPQRPENQTEGGLKTGPNLDIEKNIDSYILSPEPEGFSRLWLSYPAERRTRREEAVQLFHQAVAQGATAEAIIAALEADEASFAWSQEGGRFIPGIVKWLQKEKWREFLTEKRTEGDESWTTW